MRHLSAVLEDCARHGIHLAAKGDGLEVRGPIAQVPELREELLRHKPNILCVLRTGHCHHNLSPDVCKLCNGYVRQLIGNLERQERSLLLRENSSKATKAEKTMDTVTAERNAVKAKAIGTHPVAEPGGREDGVQ